MKSHKKINILYNELCKLITTKIVDNLSFDFKCDRYNYSLISKNLRNFIGDEVFNTLPSFEEFSKAQQDVLHNLYLNKDFDLFVNDVAGNIYQANKYSLKTLQFSGLSKIYFKSLEFTEKFQYQQNIYPLNGSFKNLDPLSATEDVLSGDSIKRRKKILLAFCAAIGKISSPEQLDELWLEIKNKVHQPILIKLQLPRNWLTRWLYGVNGDEATYSAIKYKTKINELNQKNSYYYWRLLGPIMNKDLPEELSIHIVNIGFFNTSERRILAKSLPLINKTAAAAYKEECNKKLLLGYENKEVIKFSEQIMNIF